jgi:predicted ATPase
MDPANKTLSGLGFGLSGAHRTGKTTLAKLLAEKNGWAFVTSSASAIAKTLGVDVTTMSFKERLPFQEAILADAKARYAAQEGVFFTDRTPLDFAAYMLLDTPNDLDEETADRVCDYVQDCIDTTSQYFEIVGLVQPGIAYVEEEGKPSPNEARQLALNLIINGLMFNETLETDIFQIPADVVDINERYMTVTVEVADTLSEIMKAWKTAPLS